MKRKLIRAFCITVISLCVSCIICNAEEQLPYDYTELSDEQLVECLEMIQKEIVNRHIEKTADLQKGTYVGGQEIPAGSYLLVKGVTENDSGIICLHSPDREEAEGELKLYEFIKDEEETTFFITIEEGDILELPFPVSLTVSTGVVFK